MAPAPLCSSGPGQALNRLDTTMAEVLQGPGEMSLQHGGGSITHVAAGQEWVTAGFRPLRAEVNKRERPRHWVPLLQAVRGVGSAPPWMCFTKDPAHGELLETALRLEGICALLRNPCQGRNSWSGCRQHMLEQAHP